jgi:drug/metabolite transporter (DMT)-like permease
MAARRAAAKTPPLLTVFYTSVFGVVFLSAPAFADWSAPSVRDWALMMLMGVFAAAGHYCITKACEFARASVVAPFNYVEMIAAVVTSWIIFDHFPNARVWLGIAVISACGVYISATQWRRRRRDAPVVSVDL